MRELKFRDVYETKGSVILKIFSIEDIETGNVQVFEDNNDWGALRCREQHTNYFNAYIGDTAIVSDDYDWTFEGIVKEVDGVIVVEDESSCTIPFCDILNSDMDIKITGNVHEVAV